MKHQASLFSQDLKAEINFIEADGPPRVASGGATISTARGVIPNLDKVEIKFRGQPHGLNIGGVPKKLSLDSVTANSCRNYTDRITAYRQGLLSSEVKPGQA